MGERALEKQSHDALSVLDPLQIEVGPLGVPPRDSRVHGNWLRTAEPQSSMLQQGAGRRE